MKGWHLGLLALTACSWSQDRARSAIDETRLARAREVEAEQRAPVELENHRRALASAQRQPAESAARADLDMEARLWLDTAIAIGEREQLSSQRLSEERALVELDAAITPLLRERAELAQRADLLAARAIARGEAERALHRAAQRRDLRVRLPPEELRRAANALLDRATLILLTLETLEPQPAGLSKLRAKIAEADALATKEPDAQLARADRALFLALSMLGELRSDEPPSDEEKATLAEELGVLGGEVSRGDQGLSQSFDPAFAEGRLAQGMERELERLCSLTSAHIKGPVRFAVHGASRELAEARARTVKAQLARAGCVGGRFVMVPTPVLGDGLQVSFLAY